MLKIAIIGVGSISSWHIREYLSFSDRCKIVAICDIVESQMTKSMSTLNYSANCYESYEKMLKEEEIDLVSICLPPYVHADATIAALHNNVNVLCEKPMASSLEECDKMLEAQKKSAKLLSIISQNRFTNTIYKAKKIVESKILGDKLMYTRSDARFWRGANYHDLWWRGTWEKEGGGNTLNHGIHAIDMFIWLVNKRIIEVEAVHANAFHTNSECEDISLSICRYDDGSIGETNSSLVQHREGYSFELQGYKASLEIPNIYDQSEVIVWASKLLENGFGEKDEEKIKEIKDLFKSIPDLKYEGHKAQIDDVMTSIENKKSPLITGEDGRKTIEFITASYESAHSKKTVKLPIMRSSSKFYTKQGILDNVSNFYEKSKSIDSALGDVVVPGDNR